MVLIYYIGVSLCNLVKVFILFRFYNYIFSEKKSDKWIEYTSYLIYWFCNTYLYLAFNVPMVTLITNVAAFCLLTLNYKGTFKQKAFSSVFFCVFLILIESCVYFVATKVSFDLLSENPHTNMIGHVFVAVFMYVFAEILIKRKNVSASVDLSFKYFLALLMIPVFSFGIVLYMLTLNDVTAEGLMICSLFSLMTNLAVFYLYDKIIASVLQKKEHDVLVTQNRNLRFMVDNMQVSVENTRKLNHDLRNHATVMLALAESEKNEKLVEYIENTFQIPTGSFLSGGNVVVNSILNFKKQECEGKHIEPFFHVDIPLDVDIPDDVFTIVLGNLLDNAIAAVEKMSEDRKIYVDLFQERGIVYFYVGNPYCGELKMDEKQRYLTTKEDTEIHGYGIENVEQAVERNGGAVLIEHDDHRFHVIVALATHHE